MKKLTLVAVMAALLVVVANSYAEVQQVRLSGELRLRGYWTHDLTALNSKLGGGGVNDNDTYITQRTRITVEADLEDHVMVVVTLQSEWHWGPGAIETGATEGGPPFAGGAHPDASPGTDMQIVESYVRFQELFWSPLTLTLGRQGLNFGNGLIFSTNDKAYRFDAARLTWDAADKGLTVDFVMAKLIRRPGAPGAGAFNSGQDENVFFLNVRWEPKDIKFLKDIETYLGYRSAVFGAAPGALDTYVWLFGFRGDAMPLPDKAKSWKVWWEIAVESGSDNGGGFGSGSENLNGYLVDFGTSYVFENVEWKPTAWANYTMATGHRNTETPGNRHFVPWFDYNVRGGGVLQPILSNIDIWAFGAMASPNDKWSFAASAYRYFQNHVDFGTGVSGTGGAYGNPFVDNGGVAASTNGTNRSLGWEFDISVGYMYSKDVRTGLTFGWFTPGSAYTGANGHPAGEKSDDAFEVRWEMTVNF